jgi:colanic acid biosynthesis protein WcaH
MPQKIPYEKFIEIYSQVPRLCVELVIKSAQGILLTKRAIKPALGMWHLPGGTLLKGESVAEATQRVAQEEIGCTIKLGKLLGYVEYSAEVAVGQSVSLVFQAELLSDQITLNEQASEYNYFTEIPQSTVPETKKFLEEKVI